jgi:hypothetical protein
MMKNVILAPVPLADEPRGKTRPQERSNPADGCPSKERRRSLLILSCLVGLAALTTAASGLQMVRVASLTGLIEGDEDWFACGDANHNGRNEVYMRIYSESLVCYEYAGGDTFRRFNVCQYGGTREVDAIDLAPGDSGKTDLLMYRNSGLEIFESPDSWSLPTDSVWHGLPGDSGDLHPAAIGFSDPDGDGSRDIVTAV